MDDATHTSYDEIPYESYPFQQSHPDRLATISTLFGMTPPPVDKCRVLELGCASGGNIIPMAFGLPESHFVGLDLSSRQVADGQELIKRLGLKNVELQCRNIAQVDDSLGRFDYIVCHGVWSWVPAEVRTAILALCAKLLSENGVAFISYNTYPGWHMRSIVREMMVYHTRKLTSPTQKVQQARAMLDFIVRSTTDDKNAYGTLLRTEMELLRNKSDSYLAHEHLEDDNVPVYFHQFEEQASAQGLQYLGEAELSAMSIGGFGAEVEGVLKKISSTVQEYEQYMDFLRNRMFRQTLLVRNGIKIERRVGADRLANLWVSSPVIPHGTVNVEKNDEAVFTNGAAKLTTLVPIIKASLTTLGDMWPHATPFEKLLSTVQTRLYTDPIVDAGRHDLDRRTLGGAIIDCFAKRFLELHMVPPRAANKLGDRPCVSSLARLQAERTIAVTNSRHQLIVLNELARQIVMLADGSRTVDQLCDALLEKVRSGQLHMPGSDLEKGPEAARSLLTDTLNRYLQQLVRDSLMIEAA